MLNPADGLDLRGLGTGVLALLVLSIVFVTLRDVLLSWIARVLAAYEAVGRDGIMAV